MARAKEVFIVNGSLKRVETRSVEGYGSCFLTFWRGYTGYIQVIARKVNLVVLGHRLCGLHVDYATCRLIRIAISIDLPSLAVA